ncbi:hypothetical protein [Acinetobacter tandoii]
MKIEGKLPIPMVALVGQDLIKTKKIVMRQQTVEQYYSAQIAAKQGQYFEIIDLASMTKLVDEEGLEYPVTYEMLAASSRQNRDYLVELRTDLDAKERAESEDVVLVENLDSTESA